VNTFAMYSTQDMLDLSSHSKTRFSQANGLDPEMVFKGKRLFHDPAAAQRPWFSFYAHEWAAHVLAYDISQNNVVSTQRFAREFGFANVRCQARFTGNILFPSNSFDVVWCNGVVMHTTEAKCVPSKNWQGY